MYRIEEISLDNYDEIKEIKTFLNKFNLEYEDDIDYSIAINLNGTIIATASKHKNVLKCFAVLEEYQGFGITNSLIKKIEDRMFEEGLYHFFIYTLSHNKDKFISIGYNEIITADGICILENGNKNITSFLNNIKSNNNISDNEKACIIMNANPFTLGHKYLIELAAKENDEVIVFVVSEEKSSFPFKNRFKLVKDGVVDFKNVTVVETGPYMISNATFPTYFLKKMTNVLKLQTKIDCEIFLKYYKKIFNITKRYIGNEPYCNVTKTYNNMMTSILPINGVLVIKYDRLTINNDIISASKVREYLKNNDFESIKKYVPENTYSFLISNEAKTIINNIREQNNRH